MNYWLTSDLHLQHPMMVEKGYRPADFEEQILKNLECVQPDDILVCLGDVSVYGREKEKEYLDKKKALHVLLRGNHDPSPAKSLSHGWDFVCDRFDLEKYGVKWVFSHRPIPVPEGSVNVHGHLHDSVHRSGEAIHDGRHILLSQEFMDYRPITLQRLAELKATPRWSGGRFIPWMVMEACGTHNK